MSDTFFKRSEKDPLKVGIGVSIEGKIKAQTVEKIFKRDIGNKRGREQPRPLFQRALIVNMLVFLSFSF